MILIAKIERALVFAKELGLNDQQTKELMAMILELPYFKLLESAPITQPMPWIPNSIPGYDPSQPFRIGDCPGIVPPNITFTYNGTEYQYYQGVAVDNRVIKGTLADVVAGRANHCDLPVDGGVITGTLVTMESSVEGPLMATFELKKCACSPLGQPHSDSCKSSDGLFDLPSYNS